MVSEVEFDKIFNYWWEDLKWSGVFKISWLFVKDLHHVDVQDIKVGNTPMHQLKDGNPVDFEAGKKMLELFKTSEIDSDIFEAFEFMDEREEKLRVKRDSYYEMIKQLKNKGFIPDAMKNNNFHKGNKYPNNGNRRPNGFRANNNRGYRNYKEKEENRIKQEGGHKKSEGENSEYIRKEDHK